MKIAELVPQSCIGILHGIVVFFFARNFLVLPLAELNSGYIIIFTNHIKRCAVVVPDLLICNLPVEIHIVCQDKQLLDVITGYLRIQIFGIISADIDHFADNGTNNEKSSAVHAGNGIVNYNDLFFQFFTVHAAAHSVVKIQKCYKIPFTLTEVFGNRSVFTNDFINILNTIFGSDAEPLETGVPQNFVNAVDGGFGVCIMFIQLGNLCSKLSDFFFELFPMLGYIINFCFQASNLVFITRHLIGKQKCEVLHNLRFTLFLATLLGSNNIVIRFNELIDVIDHCADFKEKRVGILQRHRF